MTGLRRRKIEVGQVWLTKKLDRINGTLEVTGRGVDLIIVAEGMAISGFDIGQKAFGYYAKHYLAIPWEPWPMYQRRANQPLQCYWMNDAGVFMSDDAEWGLWMDRKARVNDPMRGLILGPQKQEIVP